jgi:citrate lyase subunit beta / citryl-CoA lyase
MEPNGSSGSALYASRVARARAPLFVPGNRPDRFAKALGSGADALVLDLEDSVPNPKKAEARQEIARAWAQLQADAVPLMVRINGEGSDEAERDLLWLASEVSFAAIMVPKAESPDFLKHVYGRLGATPIVPIIETAQGLSSLSSLAAASGVIRLVVGHIDFMADTGITCSESQVELLPLRFAVSMATRLNGLAPPLDGVTVEINEDDRLRSDVRRAMRLGFGGKLCIHPRQIDIVYQAMKPSDAELEWARQVIAANAASGGAAIQVNGQMVDMPVVLQARRTLSRGGFEETHGDQCG